jgi:hypothetical protein
MTRLSCPCACGLLIVAGNAWSIAEAVHAHNRTPQHRRWRRRREMAEANACYRARMRREVADRRLLVAVVREVAA